MPRISTILIILLICVAACSVGIGSAFVVSRLAPSNPPNELPVFNQPAKEEPITLLFGGDVMLDRGVAFQVAKGGGDWTSIFNSISSIPRKADLFFVNLESVISDKGQNQGSMYSFRAVPPSIDALVAGHVSVVSVANNHSLDYGVEAFLDSIQRLHAAGIQTIGGGSDNKETRAPSIFDIRGTRIALLGYTSVGSPLWNAGERSPGVAWADASSLSVLRQDISSTKEAYHPDILLVSVHGGTEYQTQPDASQTTLTATALRAGADLVIWHHAHVVQPVERTNAGWVAYGLGNLVFDQNFSKETMRGSLLHVSVQDKKIVEVFPIPTILTDQFRVQMDPAAILPASLNPRNTPRNTP